jgi:hypothetical protein
VNEEDEDEDCGRVIAIQTLSNLQLIKLLQFEAGDAGRAPRLSIGANPSPPRLTDGVA